MSVVNETRKEVRLYNFLVKKFGKEKTDYFQIDELLEQASKQTSLTDFGSPDFREGLEKLCHTLNHEANLHAFGRGLSKAMLNKLLTNRLEIQARLLENPAIALRPIERPIFIIGPARTGTTLLFNLLAQDERRRCLKTWQAARPGMPLGDPKIQRKTYRQCRDSINYINYMRPDFKHLHETGPDLPEECIPLLSSSFRCKIFNTQFGGDTYSDWLEDADMSHAYQHYANQLRLLQGENLEGRNWLLKSPIHLSTFKEIFATFPDALVIQTHRTPFEFIPSNTNLRHAFRALYSYEVDRKELGQLVLRDQSKSLKQALDDRSTHGFNVIDVDYRALLQDPTAVLEAIYDHLPEQKPSNLADTVAKYLKNNPQHKHGVHKYSLAELGMTEQQVQDSFSFYFEQHTFTNTPKKAQTNVAKNQPSVATV